jgi:glycosyltransferase involved in cell wall biosynthesis
MIKKLCIDVRMINASGIGIYIQNLLPFFEKEFQLILIGDEQKISETGLRKAEIIKGSSSIYTIKEQFELFQKIPECDIFWSPHYNIPALPVKAKKRIVTIHDVFHLRYFHTLSISQKIYARYFMNAAVKLSDQIITVSDFSRKEIIKYLKASEKKINVIYNGVNENFRELSLEEKKILKKKYALPEKFILFVGNVKPHKNVGNLIKAFSLLKEDHLNHELKLLIVGKKKGLITRTENLNEIISQSRLEKEVIFIENAKPEDINTYYNLASLLILPSYYEGFGLPPLEAMKVGCPTIVSGIEIMKEVYQDASFFIDPDNSENIAEGIKKVLTDPSLQNDFRNKGKKLAEKYSWKDSAERHLEVFYNIAF